MINSQTRSNYTLFRLVQIKAQKLLNDSKNLIITEKWVCSNGVRMSTSIQHRSSERNVKTNHDVSI